MSMRTRILEATAKIIRDEGFAAVTSKRVAAEAGCAEGSIFGHFGDKGRLLGAVLSYGLPEVKTLSTAVERGADRPLREGLVDVVEAMIAFYRASFPLAATALADRQLFRAYSAGQREAGLGPQQAYRLVLTFLEAHRQAGGIVPEADLPVEALKITGACQNAVWVEMVSGAQALPHAGESLAVGLAESTARSVGTRPAVPATAGSGQA
jgi:AcrR family transcriptional regulator